MPKELARAAGSDPLCDHHFEGAALRLQEGAYTWHEASNPGTKFYQQR